MEVSLTPYVTETEAEIVSRRRRELDGEMVEYVDLEDDVGTVVSLFSQTTIGGHGRNNITIISPHVLISENVELYETARRMLIQDDMKVEVSDSEGLWTRITGSPQKIERSKMECLREISDEVERIWIRLVLSTNTDDVEPNKIDELRAHVTNQYVELLQHPDAENTFN